MATARVSHSTLQANSLLPGDSLHKRDELLLVSIVFDEKLDQHSLTHQ